MTPTLLVPLAVIVIVVMAVSFAALFGADVYAVFLGICDLFNETMQDIDVLRSAQKEDDHAEE